MEPVITIKVLETDEGKVPFHEWYFSLRDTTTRVRVRVRLDRLLLGNFGDVKSVGEGVSELRLQFGAGYRIYFGRVGTTIVVLLGGGDKSTQARDIEDAQELWRKYKDEIERYQREFEPGA
jgi:putative addiction module killer protein